MKNKRVVVLTSQKLHNKIKSIAAANGCSLSQYVEDLIKKDIDNK